MTMQIVNLSDVSICVKYWQIMLLQRCWITAILGNVISSCPYSSWVFRILLKYIYVESDSVLLNFKYNFRTNTKSTSCNLTFHSHTSQHLRQYLDIYQTVMCLTACIKHFLVGQPQKVFSIEEIKETWKFDFHPVIISWLICSDRLITTLSDMYCFATVFSVVQGMMRIYLKFIGTDLKAVLRT